MNTQELKQEILGAVQWARSQGYEIIRDSWGVSIDPYAGSTFSPAQRVCPLGACLLRGKHNEDDVEWAAAAMLGVDVEWVRYFIAGVDDEMMSENEHEAFKLGQEIFALSQEPLVQYPWVVVPEPVFWPAEVKQEVNA